MTKAPRIAAGEFSAAKMGTISWSARQSRKSQARRHTTAGLCPHPDTHEDPVCEQLFPSLAKRTADDGPETEVSSEEDGSTTTKVGVQGIRKPTADESREPGKHNWDLPRFGKKTYALPI